MKKGLMLSLSIFVLSVAVLGSGLAAQPDSQAITIKNPVTGEEKNTVTIPAKAIEVAPGLFYLGEVMHDGKLVQGYAKIGYKKAFGKPGTECGNGICEPGENARKCPADCDGGTEPEPEPDDSCYGFLAKGAKWKTLESYVVNPANIRGLDNTFVSDNLASDIAKWETAAGTNILGDGTTTSDTLVADTVSPDNKNEVYFADIVQENAIGVTIVWGVFSAPPGRRELVEWDQVYDDTDFDWSSSGETDAMDFENIATHELGHSVGMGDLYTSECSEQTMYGYASYGETKKQSLESGDIAGIQSLY